MANFQFSENELTLISASVNKGHKSWKDDCLSELKTKIKEHLKTRQRFVCCYCLRSFHGEFNFVIDIEHILPKHQHVKHMFELENLAASCKRCNMKMKGRRTDFLTEKFNSNPDPFAKENYLFIHPNRDVFEDHIAYEHHQKGRDIMVYYSVISDSAKGNFSMEFFKLEQLSVNSFSKAQGLAVEDEDFYEGNPEDDDIEDDTEIMAVSYFNIDNELEKLAIDHNQI
ncbi:HNH endonuclease [Cronobacter malonaticus]|uniref:HNH endonuclease n=1 Tax=Cronobacter malonaticus TaxID=413503 RepID=UPI000CFBAC8D|nr:HNH endonuclease [Cronobacter malonaticus]